MDNKWFGSFLVALLAASIAWGSPWRPTSDRQGTAASAATVAGDTNQARSNGAVAPAQPAGGVGECAAPCGDDLFDPCTYLAKHGVVRGDADFLIAMVPDPFDSNAAWLFDPMVEAIQAAVTKSGYVPDRFYIPDAEVPRQEGASGSTDRRKHECVPGAILFRSTEPARPHPLMVLLVPENAFGVREEPLRRSLRLIDAYETEPPADIRILGPNFSGSVASLTAVLREREFGRLTAHFRIISGGATAATNKDVLEAALAPGRVTFHATVLPDKHVLHALGSWLQRMDPTFVGGRQLALLVEENTGWGETLANQTLNAPHLRVLFGHALLLPFPLHVSRLRNLSANSAPAAKTAPTGLSNYRPFMPLSLGEDPTFASDRIPSMSPRLTASSVELMMSAIFSALKREDVGTIGLLATDTRDKLFLASEIAKRMPGVTLFTIEADVLTAHPDYNDYVKGMIVGTTYPLFLQNQGWLRGEETPRMRRLFPTTNAEGVYNAVLALLNYAEDGTPRNNAPPLLDYQPLNSSPAAILRPPVWVLVTGQDGLWPLGQLTLKDTDYGNYVQPIKASVSSRPAALAGPTVSSVFPSLWFKFAYALLLIAGIVHLAAFALRRRRSDHERAEDGLLQRAAEITGRWPLFRLFGATRSGGLYECEMLLVLAVAHGVAVTLVVVAAAHMPPGDHTFRSAGWVVAGLGSLATVGLFAAAAWAIISAVLASKPAPSTRMPLPDRLLVSLLVVLLALFAALALVHLVQYLAIYWRAPFPFVHFFERTTHPGNGVSSLPATVLLLAAIYIRALTQLEQFAAPPLDSLVADAPWLQSFGAPTERLTRVLRAPLCGLRAPSLAFVLVVAVATAVLVGTLRVVTVERWDYTRFFTWTWILVQCLVCLSLTQCLYLWARLRDVLAALSRHRMSAAFSRLPPTFFHFSPHSPDVRDVQKVVEHARSLGLSMRGLDLTLRPAAAIAGLASATPSRSAPGADFSHRLGLDCFEEEDLRQSLVPEAQQEHDGNDVATWSETGAWRNLLQTTGRLVKALDHIWSLESRRSFLHAKKDEDIDDEVQQWCLRAEDLIAMEIALVVREVLARLVNSLFAVVAMLILMVWAQSSLPVQPRQALLAVAWVYVVVTVFLAFRVFVQIEHDDVLSALSNTKAGRITWNWAFVGKVVAVGFVPLITLLTAQFPQIASTVARLFVQVQPLP